MPDIAMCANLECPKRGECYRFRATPSAFQSYAAFKPEPDGSCLRFSQISEGERAVFEERDREAP
jgi:hypothetical protein